MQICNEQVGAGKEGKNMGLSAHRDSLSYKAGMYAIVFLYICNLTFSFLFGGYQNFELCVKHK